MTSLLPNQTAVLTGGGSGIGRATALLLAEEGANVVVTDIAEQSAQDVASEITAAGGQAIGLKVDVAEEAEVAEMVATALREYGQLHCAVNCAGISMAPVAFTELTMESWHKMVAIALTGTFLAMKHELAAMEANGGSIVNISSGAGLTPAPGQPHYTAAKHGVLGLTKSAAREYASKGIRVNAICPGMTDTPMLREHLEQSPEMEKMVAQIAPPGRLALPEEMAHTAVWLCSQRASYVSGESIIVDYAGLCR